MLFSCKENWHGSNQFWPATISIISLLNKNKQENDGEYNFYGHTILNLTTLLALVNCNVDANITSLFKC